VKLSYTDSTHAYYLDGKRCKSISAVAKIPDDSFSLDAWRKRQILIGVATQPSLVEQAAAHFDDRKQLDRIAEEAMQAARSHDAANRGTAAHRITERVDLNELILDSPQARAVAAAWTRALEIAGLEVVPELVERIVVYPDRLIAGRFDRFFRRKTDGRIVAGDLKTGVNAVKYPHACAVQLWLYANAPLMAGPVPRAGGTTTRFEPLPDMDRTVGYVIHMPTDNEVDVLGVDLTAAEAGVECCFKVLEWRKTESLMIPVTEIPVDRAEWITGRLGEIAKLGAEAKAMVALTWPPGVTVKPPWSSDEIDQLDKVLADIEGVYEMPFGETDPRTHQLTHQ